MGREERQTRPKSESAEKKFSDFGGKKTGEKNTENNKHERRGEKEKEREKRRKNPLLRRTQSRFVFGRMFRRAILATRATRHVPRALTPARVSYVGVVRRSARGAT